MGLVVGIGGKETLRGTDDTLGRVAVGSIVERDPAGLQQDQQRVRSRNYQKALGLRVSGIIPRGDSLILSAVPSTDETYDRTQVWLSGDAPDFDH